MSTRHLKTGRIAFIVVWALTANTSIAENLNEPDREASPRLLRLARELQAGERQALGSFWKELDGKGPLVESMVENPRHRRVTFIWR
jgi:hypothetical protein